MAATMTERVEQRKAAAMPVVYRFANQEAAGELSESDATALAKAIDMAGINAAEYDAIVATCRQRADLVAQAGAIDDALAELNAATEAMQAHASKWAEAERKHKARADELRADAQAARNKMNAAERARAELDILTQDNRELFNIDPIDLDAHNLLSYPGNEFCAAETPNAPTVYVSAEVFDREKNRRITRRLSAARQQQEERREEGRKRLVELDRRPIVVPSSRADFITGGEARDRYAESADR